MSSALLMQLRVSQSLATTFRLAASASVTQVVPRAMTYSSGGKKTFKDKEMAEERVYFNKEDEKLLRQILRKKATATNADRSHADKERSALVEIIGKYSMTPQDVDRVIEWRHRHDF
jgi:hypothetical protein